MSSNVSLNVRDVTDWLTAGYITGSERLCPLMNMQTRFAPRLPHYIIAASAGARLSVSAASQPASRGGEQRKFERLDALVSIINDDERRRQRAAQVR